MVLNAASIVAGATYVIFNMHSHNAVLNLAGVEPPAFVSLTRYVPNHGDPKQQWTFGQAGPWNPQSTLYTIQNMGYTPSEYLGYYDPNPGVGEYIIGQEVSVQWNVSAMPDDPDTYKINFPDTDLVLDLENGNDNFEGVRAVLGQDTGASTQKWKLRKVSN